MKRTLSERLVLSFFRLVRKVVGFAKKGASNDHPRRF